MKKLFVITPVIAALLWPGLAWSEEADDDPDEEEEEEEDEDEGEGRRRREWIYVGAHLGGQYLDLEALSAGNAIDQLVDDAYSDAITSGTVDPDTPEPQRYSAENGFVWGLYGGISLGRWFRIGVRFTHSVLEVAGEGLNDETGFTFNLDLITALIEAQLRIPISIFVPFVGIGVGYAFLGGDTTIISTREADSEFGLSCFDAMGVVGLDINIGSWFSVGAAAHFSFIGFYYDGGDDATDAEATWGFATDYLARVTLRI